MLLRCPSGGSAGGLEVGAAQKSLDGVDAETATDEVAAISPALATSGARFATGSRSVPHSPRTARCVRLCGAFGRRLASFLVSSPFAAPSPRLGGLLGALTSPVNRP